MAGATRANKETLVPHQQRHHGLARLRRLAAVAAALAAAGGALNLAAAGTAQASRSPGGPGQVPVAGQHRFAWGITGSGRRVRLGKLTFTPTPVHPEKITHPRLDYMGAVNARHAPWGKRVVKPAVPQLPGIDISAYQGNINWSAVAPNIDFVYAKATEGTYYTNPYFYNQYVGPYNAGVIRGAYHFAIPNNSSGQAQADYFISHGGGWSGDGLTLPGALDIEYNPYSGGECYGLSQSSMVAWIRNFISEYVSREGVYPVIYSTTDWWSTCTGNYGGFAANDPLWIANYSASGGGPLPNGWGFYTFWQYADRGSQPGDQDVFNGAYTQLQTLAKRG
jgi:GH25 family lysozyme M1 (1,4-beta-N-acetylmuramidase)